jgi:hypothetical protein
MNNSVPLEPERPSAPKRKNWFVLIIIACIIGLWSAVAGLFFLAVVLVLRLNPGADVSFTTSNTDKKTAKRVYTWLFWSPIITVPVFIGAASSLAYSSSINEKVLAALIPLFIHVFLLLGLTSKSAFVYRHTQQGLLLMAVRAGVASLVAVNVESHIDYAVMLFFFGNGALWLIGSIVGWNQIFKGECWFMKQKGEKAIISPQGIPNLPVQKHLEQSRDSINRYKADEAKQHALAAFRSGDRDAKAQAVKLLRTLDEVEKF